MKCKECDNFRKLSAFVSGTYRFHCPDREQMINVRKDVPEEIECICSLTKEKKFVVSHEV